MLTKKLQFKEDTKSSYDDEETFKKSIMEQINYTKKNNDSFENIDSNSHIEEEKNPSRGRQLIPNIYNINKCHVNTSLNSTCESKKRFENKSIL